MISNNYECDGQMTIYDCFPFTKSRKTPKFINTKPIRLIELFGGIGAQASALERMGVKFEHYRLVEFDKYPVKSYNAIHGTNFIPTDITKISGNDLGIVNTDSFTYLLTYSFPCQDLSVAGKQRGMVKGSGTRSGLLWEVERLLNETSELPQLMLMENVPQVHAKKNMNDFQKWIGFLKSKGYSNYWQDLNAKDYGIPQNRNRCFMVSILGDYSYSFPKPIELTLKLKDVLEDKVEDKYYITSEKAKKLINSLFNQERARIQRAQVCDTLLARDYKDPKCVDMTLNNPRERDIANCIKARYDSGVSNLKQDGTGAVEIVGGGYAPNNLSSSGQL